MKPKQDKKRLDKEIENQMDREFKKVGKNIPRVYHFRADQLEKYNFPPLFNAVTIATAMPFRWEALASIISEEYPQTSHLFNPATYLLQRLAAVHDLHGVAICDRRDTFSRQEGRLRAKRRLLRYLKKRE